MPRISASDPQAVYNPTGVVREGSRGGGSSIDVRMLKSFARSKPQVLDPVPKTRQEALSNYDRHANRIVMMTLVQVLSKVVGEEPLGKSVNPDKLRIQRLDAVYRQLPHLDIELFGHTPASTEDRRRLQGQLSVLAAPDNMLLSVSRDRFHAAVAANLRGDSVSPAALRANGESAKEMQFRNEVLDGDPTIIASTLGHTLNQLVAAGNRSVDDALRNRGHLSADQLMHLGKSDRMVKDAIDRNGNLAFTKALRDASVVRRNQAGDHVLWFDQQAQRSMPRSASSLKGERDGPTSSSRKPGRQKHRHDVSFHPDTNKTKL